MKDYKEVLKINISKEKERNQGKVSEKSPRPHQIEAHGKMDEFFQTIGKRGILELPTGAGKTYTAVYWILKNILSKKIKVLWLADQGFLLEQAREEFKNNILEINSNLRKEIYLRIVSGKPRHANANSIKLSDDVLFITSGTAISNWAESRQGLDDRGNLKTDTPFRKFIDNANKENGLFIVYDEAHHTPAFERRNLLIGGSEGKTGIIEKYPETNLLGLTATPTYTNIKQRGWLWEIFNRGVFHNVSKHKLEKAKILAEANFMPERTEFNFNLDDIDVEKIVIKNQEIPQKIVEEIAKNNDRNKYLAKFYWKNKSKFGKTIIFLDRWYQCKQIEMHINKLADKEIAASVFSYVDTNKDSSYINNRKNDQNDINLSRFKDNDDSINVLLNVKMLTEGVDVPDVKSVFITRQPLLINISGCMLFNTRKNSDLELAPIFHI